MTYEDRRRMLVEAMDRAIDRIAQAEGPADDSATGVVAGALRSDFDWLTAEMPMDHYALTDLAQQVLDAADRFAIALTLPVLPAAQGVEDDAETTPRDLLCAQLTDYVVPYYFDNLDRVYEDADYRREGTRPSLEEPWAGMGRWRVEEWAEQHRALWTAVLGYVDEMYPSVSLADCPTDEANRLNADAFDAAMDGDQMDRLYLFSHAVADRLVVARI